MRKFTPLFITILLIVSFFLRITTHTYPYGSDDSNRDYLVAHHIVAYHEYPLTGPFAAVTQSRNSPSYYYFLSMFIFLKDDPIFLRIVSTLLQILTIFLVFKLAEKLFGLKTAILASTLLAFNDYSLVQSAFIWQPWVMQPFINLSYLLLLLSYQKKAFNLLPVAVFLFIFAGSIHMSVIALSPIFVILLIHIPKSQNASLRHYVGLLVTAVLSFLAFYTPLIIAFVKNPGILPSLSRGHMLALYNPSQIVLNILKIVTYFTGGSFFYSSSGALMNNYFAIIVCLALVYYFVAEQKKQERIYAFCLLTPVVLFIIYFSIIHIRIFGPNYGIHYFIPVLGLFLILLSRSLIVFFSKNNFTRLAGIILISFYMAVFLTNTYKNFYKSKPSFSLTYLNDPAINAIKTEILSIKKSNSYPDFNFFGIDSSSADSFGWKYTSTVWAVLERELGVKLVKLDDYNHDGFTQINSQNPNYMFVICPSDTAYVNLKNNCENSFFASHGKYRYSKKIFLNKSYRIDLLRREN